MGLKVLYVVDDVKKNGGILSFASGVNEAISKNINVEVVAWKSPLNIAQKGLIYLAPRNTRKKMYRKMLSRGTHANLGLANYDLIHFWQVKAAMASLNKINSPYVITCHGAEILDANIAAFQKTLFLDTLRGASLITAPSEYTRKYLIENYSIDEEKVKCIHPGINLDVATRFKRSSNSDVIIGTLSRLVKRKNIINVVKSLQILKKQYKVEFKYYLAGTGPERDSIIKLLSRSGIQYKYFDEISDADKASIFYPSLDIFVLPPTQSQKDVEGFGIVFLEANAHGVPVVAANTGGVSDAVKPGTSGIFADPENPGDIARKIYQLLGQLEKYRKSSRKWAVNFSYRKSANDFEKLYASVLHLHNK